MRIGVLSDIHGNKDALEQVIQDSASKGVENYIILGDFFSQGPFPKDVLDIVKTLPVICMIMGNHDYYIANKVFDNPAGKILGKSVNAPQLAELIENERWCMNEIREEGIEFLRKLQTTYTYNISQREVYFCCHAQPLDYETAPSSNSIITPNLEETLVSSVYYLSGHTHIPHFIKEKHMIFINPGSIGMPFDGDTKASYCIISTVKPTELEFYRIDYNINKVINDLERRKVPLSKQTIRRLKTAQI